MIDWDKAPCTKCIRLGYTAYPTDRCESGCSKHFDWLMPIGPKASRELKRTLERNIRNKKLKESRSK